MKREKLPVIATSPTGETFELGHVSRCTSSCLGAFLKREGFDNLPPEAKRLGTWERVAYSLDLSPNKYRAAYRCQGWTIAVEKEKD